MPTGLYEGTPAQSAASGAGIPSPAGTDRRGGDAASGYPSTAARRDASRNAGYHSAPAQSPSGTSRRGADTTTPAGAAFGILLGLATAAKLYPVFLLGALFVLCWRAA
ncbi:hypothetical protein, partial [Streptomyces sp. NPDC003514]